LKRIFSLLIILITLITAAAVISCSPAKKPDQPDNRTLVVPEASRVSFDTVDLKSAPKEVRDMAKLLEDRDATAWAQAGGKSYLVIVQGQKTRNYQMEVDEVLQRLTDPGFTWLDVKLAYSKSKEARPGSDPVITVVRAELNTPPQGVGFNLGGLEAAAPPAAGSTGSGAVRPAQPAPAPPATNGGAVIERPAPNQEITSPVTVQGTAGAQGQLRVRISTRGGQIIKEESIKPGPGNGAFSLTVSYSPPEMAVPGEISLIAVSGAEEKVLARVPVVIK